MSWYWVTDSALDSWQSQSHLRAKREKEYVRSSGTHAGSADWRRSGLNLAGGFAGGGGRRVCPGVLWTACLYAPRVPPGEVVLFTMADYDADGSVAPRMGVAVLSATCLPSHRLPGGNCVSSRREFRLFLMGILALPSSADGLQGFLFQKK